MNNAKHAVISGGGSGLGNGLATRLLKRGTHVSVLDLGISDDYQLALNDAANAGASKWQLFKIDITDSGLVKQAVADAINTFGDIDLAINSAGIAVNKVAAETAVDEFQRVININLNGSFNFASAVLPTLKPGARLALLASLAGFIGNYGYSAYSASKFGVVGLATVLRNEYEPKGVHISCVCPPEVKTPMVAQEHATGDPVSLEMKKFAGSLDADYACDKMLQGLDKGHWLIIPGGMAKTTTFIARHMPGLFGSIGLQLVKQTLRRQARA
jgi:3-dehydrosphinganine reductase